MPTGPAIWKKVVNKYTYDQDPRLALSTAAHFTQLKDELANKGAGILYDLISKRLINSHDKLSLEMYPNPDMGEFYSKVRKLLQNCYLSFTPNLTLLLC
jgi:Zn-dependent M16 (insulinase) family peptidase